MANQSCIARPEMFARTAHISCQQQQSYHVVPPPRSGTADPPPSPFLASRLEDRHSTEASLGLRQEKSVNNSQGIACVAAVMQGTKDPPGRQALLVLARLVS